MTLKPSQVKDDGCSIFNRLCKMLITGALKLFYALLLKENGTLGKKLRPCQLQSTALAQRYTCVKDAREDDFRDNRR